MYISDKVIEGFIKEDVPYIDLTTLILEIGLKKGKIILFTREEVVACGVEEVKKIFHKFDIDTLYCVNSGDILKKGGIFIEGTGKAENLHMAWKISQNILEYGSAIATRTKRLIEKAGIPVLVTRKNVPGTKALSVKAAIAGGALPHRLGLSETILVFKQHLEFLGGMDKFLLHISTLKRKCCEKKIIVEVDTLNEAVQLCKNGVDGIQFDKVPFETLKDNVNVIKNINPELVVLAAGGINIQNAGEYGKTGVDAIVTSSIYYGKPADVGCKMEHIQ